MNKIMTIMTFMINFYTLFPYTENKGKTTA